MTRYVTATGKTVVSRGYCCAVSTGLLTIDDDDLVRISGGHPLVRHLIPHQIKGQVAWAYGSAVALVSGYWDSTDAGGDIMMVGPPDDAAELAKLLVPLGRAMSIPAAAYDLLPAGLLVEPSGWSFRWADSPTGTSVDAAEWLRPEDAAEVDELLDAAFPEASFRPSSPRVRGWAGVRDDDGQLVACLGDSTEAPGVGFVASITSRTDRRGQGLGRQVTGWALDRLVDREGVAALWHFDGNLAARRTYDALGLYRLAMVAARPS